MTANSVRLLLIDNHDSFTFNVAQAFRTIARDDARFADLRVEVIRSDAIAIESIVADPPDYLVISPGPGGPPTDADPHGTGVSAPAITALRGRTPILGVCLGLQILGALDGAPVAPAPIPVHGKVARVSHTGRGIFAGLPDPFAVARYHSLAIRADEIPSTWELDAWTDDRLVMGVRVAGEPTWAVQFHPESYLCPDGPRLLRAFLEMRRPPEARRDRDRDRPDR